MNTVVQWLFQNWPDSRKKLGVFRKQLFFRPKIISKPAFLAEMRTFSLISIIFGEFLSAFASKNRISCPFWQEKWHRENDLDWPFEFQAWFMVFNHDKPLIYNFLTNECRLEPFSLRVQQNSSSKTHSKSR